MTGVVSTSINLILCYCDAPTAFLLVGNENDIFVNLKYGKPNIIRSKQS